MRIGVHLTLLFLKLNNVKLKYSQQELIDFGLGVASGKLNKDDIKAEFGKASSKMTAKVCEILDKELGIPDDAVYVSYFGTSDWGWNGSNF